MADGINGTGNGVTPTEHYRNLDDVPGLGPKPGDEAEPLIVKIDDPDDGSEPGVTLADGSMMIRLDGKKISVKTADQQKGAKAHDANLAEYIEPGELARICDDLLNGIDADLQSRQGWIDTRAAGIKHLALKLENPRSPSADADTAVEGQTTIRSPIMLDAVMRFQANARGELLPAGGPVKIRNDKTVKTKTRKQGELSAGLTQADDSDELGEALEQDFNHYLTVTDKEYAPDTNRMFFMQGYGGCAFKKVYKCPVRRRPLSRSVDADDIIVSDNEVSLFDCGRVTHRIKMSQSRFKRMQLSGTYLDIDVQQPVAPDPDPVEQAENEVAGLSSWSQRPQDYKHTVYETYCELDIAGFEHKEKGRYTGLPLAYKVSIDKDSQTVVEVRRNWKEGDDRFLKKMPIVKYPFVEGLGFYGIGLLNIMGNATAAITTAWRLALDSACFASWPGFLYSETVGRQDTMTFRVGMGSGNRINTGGQPIGQHVMAIPYKDATPGLVNITQHIEEEARRVGGTPELMVGEGRGDVPVGTTLAMLDQAVKVIDSVHKGMHIAQSEELSLLRDLFIDDPEALICSNPTPARRWEMEDLKRALQNCNLTPQSDPNTPSHTIRVMKAVALIQLVQMKPDEFDLWKVIQRVTNMVGLGDIDELRSPSQGNNPNPEAMKDMADIQVKIAELGQREKDGQRKAIYDELSAKMKLVGEYMKFISNREERQSRAAESAAKLAIERMQLGEGALIHPDAIEAAQAYASRWPGPDLTGRPGGGRVI